MSGGTDAPRTIAELVPLPVRSVTNSPRHPSGVDRGRRRASCRQRSDVTLVVTGDDIAIATGNEPLSNERRRQSIERMPRRAITPKNQASSREPSCQSGSAIWCGRWVQLGMSWCVRCRAREAPDRASEGAVLLISLAWNGSW